MTDTGTVIAEVLAGRHDGHLMGIVEAITARLVQTNQPTRWRLRIDDVEATEESITFGEARMVEQVLSAARGMPVGWAAVNPTETTGDLIAVLAVVLSTRGGVNLTEAERRVAQIPMSEFKSHIDLYEIEAAPKD